MDRAFRRLKRKETLLLAQLFGLTSPPLLVARKIFAVSGFEPRCCIDESTKRGRDVQAENETAARTVA